MTLNLWNDQRWEEREDAVRRCLETLDPDILCLQELRESTRERLDEFLPDHSRVHDDFPGWTCEGNVYWRDEYSEKLAHGAEEVGILEEDRRLFWIRLELESGETLLVSTAHFTYPGHEHEQETGESPRVEQATRTVDALDDRSRDGEPVLFMGDLNDPVHPRRILSEAGYTDCFSELNLPVRPTFPARPTRADVESITEIPLDWIVANEGARSVSATVPEFHHRDFAPSDHWPVLSVYELSD